MDLDLGDNSSVLMHILCTHRRPTCDSQQLMASQRTQLERVVPDNAWSNLRTKQKSSRQF